MIEREQYPSGNHPQESEICKGGQGRSDSEVEMTGSVLCTVFAFFFVLIGLYFCWLLLRFLTLAVIAAWVLWLCRSRLVALWGYIGRQLIVNRIRS